MSKLLSIGEALIVFKEIWNSASGFFVEAVPGDFLKSLDKITFLTSKFLGFNSAGEFFDKTKVISEAIINISNLLIWGLLLFYGFRSIFSYFFTKKVDVPWKMFIRIIIFGILANTAFFICYTGVYFTENITEYIRSCGENKEISFSILEDYIDIEESHEEDDEEISMYTLDALISVFSYFTAFFMAVCLGARYILLKVLILFSPIFFILGGFKYSEKIFFGWCKKIIFSLFLQIIICVSLSVFEMANIDNQLLCAILACSLSFLVSKNVLKFLNLSY